ncbi:MAG: hypothetical protein LBC51_04510 [Treponema sp.]|nr:hypothetical protein [Treponema sp.]
MCHMVSSSFLRSSSSPPPEKTNAKSSTWGLLAKGVTSLLTASMPFTSTYTCTIPDASRTESL